MAIYHFTARIVSRERGQSSVASAAYRSGTSLHDERIGRAFDFSRRRGVDHAEILAPAGAPDWMKERETLWNAVEKVERRKDSQLARDIEVALPVELSKQQQVELLRDYAQRAFVSQGMVADLAVHRDNPENPHGHLMLTMRQLTAEGFGRKRRDWNTERALQRWRSLWAEVQNEHLARAGYDIRVDHRSLEAQGLDLVPGRKIGVSLERQKRAGLPNRIADRVVEQNRIARENGERILADPRIALKALTYHRATFTDHDLAKWLHTRTEGAEQFRATHLKILGSRELVTLGRDDRGRTRYTSREMLAVEASLLGRARQLLGRDRHAVAGRRAAAALSKHDLTDEQRSAFEGLVAQGDLKTLVGVAGSGKSRLLAATREAWEAEGYTVKGAALSGIAAENLALAAGISSRTLASFEHAWQRGRDELTANDVLVIDEAGMIGTRQLARVLEAARSARAKVVLVGDPEQLQAIEAGAAFRGVLAETVPAELNQVRRQVQPWQQEATRSLANGNAAEALLAYERQGSVFQFETREAARAALLARWAEAAREHPEESRLMLAYTLEDVRQLNELAREQRRERGELGRSARIETERGQKEFAVGERLYFLRNERSLGVKNGSLGTVEAIRRGVLEVKLDGSGDRVLVDSRFYRDLDYGYAATVHKAQASTVGRTYVLASSHYDLHSTYVALSRHREQAMVFYGSEDFKLPWATESLTAQQARQRFLDVLSRARPKELAHDFLEREPAESNLEEHFHSLESLEGAQQRAAERWKRGFGHGVAEIDSERALSQEHMPARSGPEESLDL